ncbi:MAG: IPT/TIG domain-containing protein, partial [Acidobacteriota bacterium]
MAGDFLVTKSGPTTLTFQVPKISGVSPRYAVPGGGLQLHGDGFDCRRAHALKVYFGEARAQVTRVSSKGISVIVPRVTVPAAMRVEVDGRSSELFPAPLARTLAEQLHPVANPVFDVEGNLLVTFSGSRGEKVPVSIFRIDVDGNLKPFLTEILNPTGMALDKDGALYVSSRQQGAVYRVGPDRQVELVADELGVATGL